MGSALGTRRPGISGAGACGTPAVLGWLDPTRHPGSEVPVCCSLVAGHTDTHQAYYADRLYNWRADAAERVPADRQGSRVNGIHPRLSQGRVGVHVNSSSGLVTSLAPTRPPRQSDDEGFRIPTRNAGTSGLSASARN